MPDRKASLFARLVIANHGTLAKSKRAQFAELSDDEVTRLEMAVQRAIDASS